MFMVFPLEHVVQIKVQLHTKKSIRFAASVLFYHPYIVQGTTYPKMDPCVT
jgi:hypothetical protein